MRFDAGTPNALCHVGQAMIALLLRGIMGGGSARAARIAGLATAMLRASSITA
jgi:hypothetical protein